MTADEIRDTVEAILAAATLEEKVGMMSGRGFFAAMAEDGRIWGARPYRAGGGIERLGVPAFYFTDGPRGVTRGSSTCFPCAMARGAAFDRDLERRVGEVMGIEARAQDCNLSGAVCINLLRHPAWGRAQETYGEDPFHLGEMGAALGVGIQTHNVCATVKHFALNSMENARFKVDVRADERTLHEVYLPHFRRVLDAGVASVMSAYNKANGEYCAENRTLLTGILREEWGFEGWVHSDWVRGVHDISAVTAGLDVENPEPLVWGDKLTAAVRDGSMAPEAIDQACRRILTVLYRFSAANDPFSDYPAHLVCRPEHLALACEVAEKSAVLLKNDGVLPLARGRIRRLALLGRLARMVNTGDNGSSKVRAPYVVTAEEGLRRRLGQGVEILLGDETDLDAARNAASTADAVIVVAGYTADEEGEYIIGDVTLGADGAQGLGLPASKGGDRLDLGLPPEQVMLIAAARASGRPVIVVLVAGSAVIVDPWLDQADALLQTFYSGMEGGVALAHLLFGEVSPSGKLPFTVARRAEHYPFFNPDAETIEYGPYHGYTLLEREGIEPRFAFGHGLSYSSFSYQDLRLGRAQGGIEAEVTVRNDGRRQADEIVQLYVGFPQTEVERPVKLLRGFQRVGLAPGEARTVHFFVPDSDLAYWRTATQSWAMEPGEHRVYVGGSSQADQLLSQVIQVPATAAPRD